jgi:hypothetical protein
MGGEGTFLLVWDLPLIAAIDDHMRFIPSGRFFYRKLGINVFMVIYDDFYSIWVTGGNLFR